MATKAGWAATVVAAASAMGVLVVAVSASAATVTVGPINPVAFDLNGHPANSNFTVFVQGDVALNADEAEGTVAAGGDLSFASGYNVGVGAAFPDPFTAPGDSAPTYLYVRGGVDFPASGTNVLKVLNGGYTKIGDTSTYVDLDRDQNNAVVSYNIVPPGGVYGGVPRIEGTVTETPESVGAPVGTDLVDIDGAFGEYTRLSSQLGQCPATVTLTDAAGEPITSPIAPGSNARLSLVPGQTNVLNIDVSDLAALGELTFDSPPTDTTPLIVNVLGQTFEGTFPNLAGIGPAQAYFLLWNFPTASAVTVTGGDTLEGTIYAPRADLNWQVTQNIEGNIIAAQFTHGVRAVGGTTPREVHSFPFSTEVSCAYEGQGVTPTPTPPAPTPTGTDPAVASVTDPATPQLAESGSDGTGGLYAGALALAVIAAGTAGLLLRRRASDRRR